MTLETLETHRCFGGTQGVYRHASAATGTAMAFSVFVELLNLRMRKVSVAPVQLHEAYTPGEGAEATR